MQKISLWRQRIGDEIDQASPKLLGAYLFYALALVFLLTQLELIGGDSPATVYLPVAILRWGTLRLDPLIGQVPVLFDLENEPAYLVEVNGHYYSKYSPLPALLSIPIYAIYMLIGPADNYFVYLTLSRLMSVLVSTTTAVVVFYLLRNLLPQRRALVLAFIYGLATFTWPMATNTFATQNTGEMFLALAALMVVKASTAEGKVQTIKQYALAGLFASLAVASRPQVLPAAALLSIYVFHQTWKNWPRLISYLVAAIPAALLLGIYNTWAFGLPWRFGYQNEAGYGWSYPIWKGLAGILISPSHGLLMYSPVMLLAFIGAWALWRKAGKELPLWALGRYLSIICLVQLLLMSSWHYWNGGNAYNQRMLHEVLPLIILLVGYAWRVLQTNRAFNLALLITSAWGIWMNVVRAAFYDQHIFWSEIYKPEIDWSLKFSELAMYLHWYGPLGTLAGAGQVVLMVGGLLLAPTVVMLRFVMVSNAKNVLHEWLYRLALALNIGIALSFFGLGSIAVRQGLLWRADFTAFYTGGAIIRDGLGHQLYDYDLQTHYQKEMLGEQSFSEGLLPFNYPPHAALLFMPLAIFFRPTAFWLWAMLQTGLLAWLLVILWRYSVSWSRRERWLLLTGVLAYLPLLTNFLLGAFSLFVLNCLLSWIIHLKRGKDTLAGLWLAAGSFKPQTIVLPGLMLLFAHRWRAVLAAAVGGIAIAAFSSIFLGPTIWLEFLRVLKLSASFFNEYGIYPSTMYNLKGTLAIWLGAENASLINAISLVGFLFSIGVTWWLWRGPWRPEHPDFELRMAITLMISILFGLHVNPQDGLLLIAPAILFYEYLRQENLSRQALGIFLGLCPLIFLLSEFTIRDQLGVRLPVLAIAVLLGWQVWAWQKRSTRSTQA